VYVDLGKTRDFLNADLVYAIFIFFLLD